MQFYPNVAKHNNSPKKQTFTWDTQENLRILHPKSEHQSSVSKSKAKNNEKTRTLS